MIIRDKIYISTDVLGRHVNKLCALFTYRNPEYWLKKRMKLSVTNIDQYLFHYNLTHNTLELPRGALPKVQEFLIENKIADRILDQRSISNPIDISLQETEIESQQETLLELFRENDGGLIEMSCGAGKTVAVLAFLAEIKQKTLIIVHEFRLSNQWIGELKRRFKGNFTIGKFDGEKKEIGDVTVAIINSVYTEYQENPKFLDQFGCVVLDETHHLPAHTFSSVVNNIPAKYRIGVTATVKRKDGMEILLKDIIGEPLTSIKSHKVKHRITSFDFKIVNTNIRFHIPIVMRWTGRQSEPAIDFTKCLTILVENKDRNNLILKEVSDAIENGYFPMVLSDRVKHNKLLHESLLQLGYKSILLIGETRNKSKLEDIKSDESIQCIVANTKIASEGLDIPRLSAILLTCPSSNLPKLEQQIGRVRRSIPGKQKPLVVDFCDNLAIMNNSVYLLNRMAEKRIKHYMKLQEEYSANF